MSPVPVAPSAPPGPSASSSQSSGPAPATNFTDVLTNHQARTDHPEGQARSDDTPQATPDHKAATTPAGKAAPSDDGKPSGDAAQTAQAEAAAAALATNPAVTPVVAVSIADTPAAAAAATGTAVTAAPAAAVTALASQAQAQAQAQAGKVVPVPGQPGVPVPPAAQDPATATPTTAQPAAGDAAQAQAQAATGMPLPGAPAQPAAADVKPPVAPGADQPAVPQAPQPQADAAPAIPAAPVTATPQPGDGQAQGQDAGTQSQPQPQQAPVVPAGLQPVAVQHTAAPSGVAYVAHSVPLNTAEAVERIHELVHLANANGTAQARVELHPAELGGVTIQLKVTAAGLQAHITADRPEALPLLQQAGDDLRKSLVDRGVEVNHLDFGMQGGSEAGAWREQGRAQQELAGDLRGTGPDAAADDLSADPVPTPTDVTPAGALVDVKA